MVQYIFLFINKFYLSFFIYFILLTKYSLIKSNIGVWPDTFEDYDQIFKTDKEVSESDFYASIFGHRLMMPNQIVFEDSAIEYEDINYQEKQLSEFVTKFIKGE